MTIIWSITDRNGAALPLTDKEVHLYYTCERGRFEADIEIQDGNVVIWHFFAKDQRVLGDYKLTLTILQSAGKRAIRRDICTAFTLVGRACEENYDDDEANINEGGEITLASELDIYRISPIIPTIGANENWRVDGVDTGLPSRGRSAYEYAVSQGYKGTEEEFAEELKKATEQPDWNAQIGDAGHIKNRTHYVYDYIFSGKLSEGELRNGSYVFNVLLHDRVSLLVKGYTSFDKEQLLISLRPNEEQFFFFESGERFTITLQHNLELDLYELVITPEDGLLGSHNELDILIVDTVEHIAKLSEAYIPDTILRKSDVDTALFIESENPVANRVITEKFDDIEKSLEKKADSSTLAKVAKSGSYNDLSNKPTIPTKVSQLTNDKNYASQSQVDDLRTEILGDLEADDAETIKDINVEITELYRQIDTINDAGYIKIGDVQTEIGKLGGSAYDTQNGLVDVTVTTKGGQVDSVDVGVTGLDTALAGKADLENGKILASQLPDYILGQVMFGGVITYGSNTTSTIEFSQSFIDKYNPTGLDGSVGVLSSPEASQYEGVYFILQGTAKSNAVWNVSDVKTGDWVISTGASWSKVDNTDAVSSVAGLYGAITATALAKKLAETGDANELALKSELNNKQDKLVSGTNIKTINGNSILGSGNIVIEGGSGGSTVQPDWNAMKGEAGYIENNPFILRHGYEGDEVTKDILEQYKLNLDEFEEYTFVDNYGESFTGLRKEIEGYGFLNQILHNVHVVGSGNFTKGSFILSNFYYISFGDIGEITFNEEDINDKRYITINWYNNFSAIDELPNFDVYIIPDWDPFFMDTLPSELLPDTVVKTTRQYLSDSQKNQVKENLGISFSTPDWNAQEGQSGYIKNRTHYVTEISIGTSEYTRLEGIPKRHDPDSEIYYAAKEIHVQYREDDYIGIIKIPANTPLGYRAEATPFTVIGDDNGEEFTFSSYSDGDIFFKVEDPNSGTDFRVLLYTPLGETYIPDSILNGGYLYSNGEKVDMRFTRSLLPVGTRIPASANLHTIEFLKIGKYYCSLNADAKTIKNCPVNVAFSMEVFNPLGTNVDDETTNDYTYRLRVLTQYNTGQQYVQFCRTNGTAGSWIYDSWYVTPRAKFALASSKNDGSAAIGANNKGVYIDSTGEIKAMSYTIAKNVPSNAVFTDTDTKVTAVGNHYAPAEDSTQQIDAPSGEVVTGIKRDAAGHVVGVVSAPQTGGGGTGEGSDNVYITDFTINDLQRLIADPDLSIQADMPRLRDALAAHKVVLVPYDSNEGFRGCGIATGYSEDLLYVTIIFDNGSIYIETEINGEEIHSREVEQRPYYESVRQMVIGDLDYVAMANGIGTTIGGMLYAFPDTITGEEDDVLLSRATVKTINGQGLFVDENSNDITVAYPEEMATSTAMELQPNTVTSWGGSVSGTIQIAFAPSPQGHVSEYIARFTVGSDGLQLIVPDNVVWADGVLPAMTPGKTYEISFMDGYATFLEF